MFANPTTLKYVTPGACPAEAFSVDPENTITPVNNNAVINLLGNYFEIQK